MTPVEATATRSCGTPAAIAAAPCIFAASSSPRPPVAAFALPEFDGDGAQAVEPRALLRHDAPARRARPSA